MSCHANIFILSLAITIMTLTGCSSDSNPAAPIPEPIANFSWTGEQIAPATITFSNTSQHSNRYRWDFADGTTSTETNPTHVFQTAQTFQVVLIAVDSVSGKSNTTFKSLTIERPFPVSDFTWSGSTAAPANITFAAHCQNTNRYLWDFGDGATASSQNPTHVFTTPRYYQITLIAIDSVSSKSDTTSKGLTITYPDPVSDFTWTGATVTPAQIQFVNRSQHADRYQWDFGDGRTSIQATPLLSYSTMGTYSIVLIATNTSASKSDTTKKQLTITPGTCYLNSFIVDQIPWTMPDGSAWDNNGTPPDLQVDFCDAANNILISTQTIVDIQHAQLPAQCTLDTPFHFPSLNSNWRFNLYDDDSPFGFEAMGSVSFIMNSLASDAGYVSSYTLAGVNIRMRILVRWE